MTDAPSIDPLRVSAAGGLVLGILRDHGAMTPSELGERLIVTRATVTGLLDSLERTGFVRRSANPADRRSLVVEITPAGLTVVRELRTIVHRNEKAWLDVLSDNELQEYIERLHRIQDRLAADPGSGLWRSPTEASPGALPATRARRRPPARPASRSAP